MDGVTRHHHHHDHHASTSRRDQEAGKKCRERDEPARTGGHYAARSNQWTANPTNQISNALNSTRKRSQSLEFKPNGSETPKLSSAEFPPLLVQRRSTTTSLHLITAEQADCSEKAVSKYSSGSVWSQAHISKTSHPASPRRVVNPWMQQRPHPNLAAQDMETKTVVVQKPVAWSQVLVRPPPSSSRQATSSTTTQTVPFSPPINPSAETAKSRIGAVTVVNHQTTLSASHASYTAAVTTPTLLSLKSKVTHAVAQTNVSMSEFFGAGSLNASSPSLPSRALAPAATQSNMRIPTINELLPTDSRIQSQSQPQYQPHQPPTPQLGPNPFETMGHNAPVPLSVIGPPVSPLYHQQLRHMHQQQHLNHFSSQSTTGIIGRTTTPRGFCSDRYGKKLSVFAVPFVPGGSVGEVSSLGGCSDRGGSSNPFASSYRGSLDDMETSSSLKKANMQSRHSRKNRNTNEIDYYFSEDEDMNESSTSAGHMFHSNVSGSPHFFRFPNHLNSPSVSYAASVSGSSSVHPNEVDADMEEADAMSISSEESVEFVINEGARCLPLFITDAAADFFGVANNGGDGRAKVAGQPISRSFSVQPQQTVRNPVVGRNEGRSGKDATLAGPRKRSVSVHAAPPTIFRDVGSSRTMHFQQQPMFSWNQPVSLSASKVQSSNASESGGNNGALMSLLNGPAQKPSPSPSVTSSYSARMGRSHRRHSHTHQYGRGKQRTIVSHSHVRRSKSISDVKAKSSGNPPSFSSINPSDISALHSMSLNTDLSNLSTTDGQCAPAGSSASSTSGQTLSLPFLPSLPNLSRFEFSKRFYMDLELPWQYRQLNRPRKTAQVRRSRARVSSTSEVMGVIANDASAFRIAAQKHGSIGVEAEGPDFLLMRTSSLPSLLPKSVADGLGLSVARTVGASNTTLIDDDDVPSGCATEVSSPLDVVEYPTSWNDSSDLIMGVARMHLTDETKTLSARMMEFSSFGVTELQEMRKPTRTASGGIFRSISHLFYSIS
ncbi:hypothetical protein BC830DRAFT_1164078 [Chytriomyces sp. MP71]|nr:hypothetical protein BC830DRAFT_1164078 [Chytriomyces sp. MP71]